MSACVLKCGFYFSFSVVRSIDQAMIATEKIVCYSPFLRGRGKPQQTGPGCRGRKTYGQEALLCFPWEVAGKAG